MVSGHPTSTSFSQVDNWSTDPWVLGHHTHTFHRESFPAFLDSINALRSKLTVLIETTSGNGSSSIAIASFFVKELEHPFVDPVLYDIYETPTCITSAIP